MSHNDILVKFGEIFSDNEYFAVKNWFTNGRNSIRLSLETGQIMVFTFIDDDNWTLETLKSWLDNVKLR